MLKIQKELKLGFREKLFILCPALIISISALLITYYFVDPFPPPRFSIGCGPPGGANYKYAQAYREILSREGITLDLITSAGSAENLKLLEAESNGVDVAFVQGSMRSLVQDTDLVSLGSLFFEPLWIFHRKDLAARRIPDLKGLRLAVGEEGGGTKILTMHLLEKNGLDSENSKILSYGYQKATDMLLNDEVDAAFFVSTHLATHVIQLIDSKSVELMGLERAEAYALLYHYLYVLELPEGVIDFEANIPARDLKLVAPTTQLVARPTLHPALINILLEAAMVVHEFGGEFEREGMFPTSKYLDFNLSPEAERFYKHGPPFLQRYLPFWIAIFVSRMTFLILPLVAVVFPIFKLLPLVYRWRMRSKIYRWYGKLRKFDPERHQAEGTEQLQADLDGLEGVEEKVSNISVPLSYSEELYHLRLHIDMLRRKLKQMIDS
ncbi:TRAP transporter solute receptor, TAXI family [Olavius algarvensis Delta 1 endosymbiont]|nr:TRAP transporter solute receptor, TAXI family [Olavius algarvensis Delta 1 endosymbiont]